MVHAHWLAIQLARDVIDARKPFGLYVFLRRKIN